MKTDWREQYDKEFKLSANWDKFFGEGFVKQMNDLHNQQKDFIQFLLDQQREEIHTDMLKTCENWHGTGVAMINDYFNKIKDK